MGTWQHIIAGQVATEVWPDELDDWYRAQAGYTEVLPVSAQADQRAQIEAEVAELKGEALAEAVEAAGIDPKLHADEKRAALVDQRIGGGNLELTGDGSGQALPPIVSGPQITGVTVTSSPAAPAEGIDQTQEH